MRRTMAVIRAVASIGVALMALGMNTAWAQATPQVIVKWKTSPAPSVISASQARFGVTLTTLRTLPTGGQVLKANRTMSSTELQNLVADLGKSTAIQYVHIDTVLRKQMTPNDTRFNEQWNLLNAVGGIDLQRAWDLATGAGVRIAVLDTGYRPNLDLTPNVVGGYDFISDPFISNDGNGRDSDATDPGDGVAAGFCGPNAPATNSTWHGTHVMGTIAAVANNGVGVAGVAFGAKVVPVRVLGRCDLALLSDVAEAAIWAAGGSIQGVPANPFPAKVINMSLAAPAACDPTSQGVIDIVRSLGAVVVVAAGNGNVDAANFLPASCTGVLTVAATTKQGGKASYSNFGQAVDIAAPGGDTRTVSSDGVLSTMNLGTTSPGTEGYGFDDGTSTATAHVSGVVALMLSKANLTPDQVDSLIRRTARPFPQTCNQCGEGIVDAFDAVDATMNLPRAVAFLEGGILELKYAGNAQTLVAEEFGFATEYRLVRRNSRGDVAQDIRQSTPVFNFPAMGCVGESMNFTLTVTDPLGRTDTWSQRMTFIFNPFGGASIPCGR